MPPDASIIQTIPDDKPVRVFLPLQKTVQRYRATGVYRKGDQQSFSLIFEAGILPEDPLDLSQPCIITIDMGGRSTSLEAHIIKIASPQQLEMTTSKVMSHEQMREFFRVDAVTQIFGQSFYSDVFDDTDENWILRGKTIDISGNGVLATFPSPPPENKAIHLKITLPNDEKETIEVLAKPVRTRETGDNIYEVAFTFTKIKSEDRDKIIGCCFEIQRKLLRLKVRVKDL